MHYFEFYYENVLKYDLLNRFYYRSISDLPRLYAIILNFGVKKTNLKSLLTSLLALELVTTKKGTFTSSNKINISLKIKKGNVVGCKLILKKKEMYIFLAKLMNEIVPKLNNFSGFKVSSKKNTKDAAYRLQNPLLFTELESNYYLFNKLPELDITFLTNSVSLNEFAFLLNSFKLPIVFKNCKRNSIGRV